MTLHMPLWFDHPNVWPINFFQPLFNHVWKEFYLIWFILSFYVSYVHHLNYNFNPFIIETKLKGTASLSRTIILHPPQNPHPQPSAKIPSDLEFSTRVQVGQETSRHDISKIQKYHENENMVFVVFASMIIKYWGYP